MSEPSPQDLARVAASIRLTGELLEAHGSRALVVTRQWGSGPKSPNLQPMRGNRSETVTWGDDEVVVAIPSDPTGEEAIDDEDVDNESHRRLLDLIHQADVIGYELRMMLHRACPQGTGVIPHEPETNAEISLAGWCVSCHRDGGYCEPVAMNPDGSRRHRDFCLWCARYMAEHRKLLEASLATLTGKAKKQARADMKKETPMPPIELVRARHEGRRVTQQMVEQAMRKKAS